MPTGTPFKTWILGAVVVGALLVCGILLRRGTPVPVTPKTPVASQSAVVPDKKKWLVTARDVPPSALLEDLKARYETATEDKARAFAIMGASKLGEPAAVVWLAELAAKEARPGGPATRALAQITNRRSNLELGDVATSDGPAPVRAAAIAALVATGDLAQAAQLSALVADSNQPFLVRQAAATALGQMKRPAAVPALANTLDGLENDSSRQGQQLRIAAVQALGLIGTAEARATLEARAHKNLSPAERTVVDNALRLPQR